MAGVLDTVNQRTRLAGHNRLELLLFRLVGRQRYGINVFKVQEVIQCPPLTRVPHAHVVVRGIANMRGNTIPIMDLSMAVGKRAVDDLSDSFVIITEYNRRTQGFLVNGVERIINIEWADVLPPPKGAGGGSYMTAVTKVDEELVEIIDVEKVLADVIGQGIEISEKTREEVRDVGARTAHILVVDDSSVARNQIRRTLEQLGVECTLAKNGREGLEQLRAWVADDRPVSETISMVISDIEMPEMDGYTLTTEIRKDQRLKDLYVVLHTSLSGVFNKAMVEKVGANEFIPKFNADDLGKTIIRHVSHSALSAAGSQ